MELSDHHLKEDIQRASERESDTVFEISDPEIEFHMVFDILSDIDEDHPMHSECNSHHRCLELERAPEKQHNLADDGFWVFCCLRRR